MERANQHLFAAYCRVEKENKIKTRHIDESSKVENTSTHHFEVDFSKDDSDVDKLFSKDNNYLEDKINDFLEGDIQAFWINIDNISYSKKNSIES